MGVTPSVDLLNRPYSWNNMDNENNNINNIHHKLNHNKNKCWIKLSHYKRRKGQIQSLDTERMENTENKTCTTAQYKIVQELAKMSKTPNRPRSNSLNDTSYIIKQRNSNEENKNRNVRNDDNKQSSSFNDGWQKVTKRKRNSPGQTSVRFK